MKTFSLFIFSFFTSFISLSHLALAMEEGNKEDGKIVFVSQGNYNGNLNMEKGSPEKEAEYKDLKEEEILSSPPDLLPSEVTQHIFSFSDINDLKNLSSVSIKAKEFASRALGHKTITLHNPLFPQGAENDGPPFINPFFASASSVKLHTQDPSLNPLIEAVVGFPRLTALTCSSGIQARNLEDEDLKLLQKCTQLTSLNLKGYVGIKDEGLESLASLVNLKSLTLRGGKKITGKGLESLPEKLTSLSLKGCDKITDEGLKSLKKLTNLTSLNLSHLGLINKGLKSLPKNLISLNLCGCWGIADEGLESLTHLTTLTSLNLWGCEGITDKGLESLKKLTNLTSLNIEECGEI
jgi:hypothetical protein